MANNEEIKKLARELNLMNIANGRINIDDTKLSNKDYLYNLLSQEILYRHNNRNLRLHRDSKLPKLQFNHRKISKGLKWQLKKIKDFDFSSSHQNIIITGDCSTGKTSLAVEIGNYAIDNNSKVFYLTLEDFILDIKEKNKIYKKILTSDVLIIDDVFYTPISDEDLLLIYKSFLFLMDTRSLVLVTNRPLSKWSEMKVDQHLLETLKQRFLRDAQLIILS